MRSGRLNADEAISMLKFARSKRIPFIIVTVGLLLIVVLWWRLAPDRRLRAEAETSSLACALYAARQSAHDNGEMVCKAAVAFAEAGDFNEVDEIGYFVFSYSTLSRPRFYRSTYNRKTQ